MENKVGGVEQLKSRHYTLTFTYKSLWRIHEFQNQGEVPVR